MIDEYGVLTRRRWTRRSVGFATTGAFLIIFDIAIINWTLTLPQGFGRLLWVGVIVSGIALILFSPDSEKLAPLPPSKASAEQIDRWEKSGGIATILNDVSLDETQRIEYFTRRHFGKTVYATGTSRKGEGRTFTMFKGRLSEQAGAQINLDFASFR